MRNFFKYILFFISTILFFYVISNISNWLDTEGIEIDLNEIKMERELVLTEIDTLRGNSPDLFIFTDLKNNKIYKMYLGTIDMDLYRFLKKEDLLFKKANENICIVTRNNQSATFSFIRIPYKSRLNKNFPKEWRCKWLEASNWDSLSIHKKEVLEICKTIPR